MMKSLFFFAVILSFGTVCFSQHQLAALERAKEIRLLQDDREAVKTILHSYELNFSSDNSDIFTAPDATIEVTYSSGVCDEDEDEIWNVPEGKVTRIEVIPDEELKLEDFGIDLSVLLKEQIYASVEDEFIYHSKRNGFAIMVGEDTVERFILFPRSTSKAETCKSKVAKEFASSKSWFGSKKLEDRRIVCGNMVANVTDVALSTEELSAFSTKEITVSVTATDPENDVLTYSYFVSAGRIIGTGSKVVWDLRGVGSGSYTITAGVDDGCGLCGATKTKTVVIK